MSSSPTLTLTLTLTFMPTFTEVTEHRAASGSGGWWDGPTLTVQSLTPHRHTGLVTNTNTLHTCVLVETRGEGKDKTNVMK